MREGSTEILPCAHLATLLTPNYYIWFLSHSELCLQLVCLLSFLGITTFTTKLISREILVEFKSLLLHASLLVWDTSLQDILWMIAFNEIKVTWGVKTLIAEYVFYTTSGVPLATWWDKCENRIIRDTEGWGLLSRLFAEFWISTGKMLRGHGCFVRLQKQQGARSVM